MTNTFDIFRVFHGLALKTILKLQNRFKHFTKLRMHHPSFETIVTLEVNGTHLVQINKSIVLVR